jgi:hypothetical protein
VRIKKRIRERLHQLRQKPWLIVGLEPVGIDGKALGQLQENRRRDGSLVMFEKVEIAGAYFDLLRHLRLRQFVFLPQAANFGPKTHRHSSPSAHLQVLQFHTLLG